MSGKQCQHDLQNSNSGYMEFNVLTSVKKHIQHNLDFLSLVIILIFVVEKVSNASLI